MSGGIIVASVVVVGVAAAYTITSSSKRTGIPPDARSETIIRALRSNVMRIDPKLAKIPIYEGGKSETIDKSVIYLCLRSTKGYYSMNTLMYVLLHELAHTQCKNYVTSENGHVDDEEFQKHFTELKRKASLLGVWDPSQPLPEVYCGIRNR